jgi:hypothetical protein
LNGLTTAIAMFGWIPLVLALFVFLPARRAALAGVIAGWMFLPVAAYRIEGLPDYTKMSATCGVVLLAIAIFDFRRLISLRPRLVDLPVMLFCLSAFISAMTNGLGMHEGLSAMFDRGIVWGVPYAIGRLYFDRLPWLRELALGIFAGGLLYAPLCWWELAKGPELHRVIYGFYPPFPDRETRFGILRPMVFMHSGLMVAVWLAAATVLGIWLWRSGALTRAAPNRAATVRERLWLVAALAITTISLRSVNGWVLLALGAGLLALHSWWRSAAPAIAIMALICGYVSIRAAGLWSGEQTVPVVERLINAKKGRSIRFRLRNENIIAANVRQRPVFGWGRQMAPAADHHGGYVVWDSLWIIVFAQSGAFGLASVMAILLTPAALFLRRFPAAQWQDAAVAPAAALAVTLILYATDNLANAMVNPVFMLAAGGLSGLGSERIACRDKTYKT